MITQYVITRHAVPHERCGICDEAIEKGEPTRYVDDERCHLRCADDSYGLRAEEYEWREFLHCDQPRRYPSPADEEATR